jgi:hypothetical protein
MTYSLSRSLLAGAATAVLIGIATLPAPAKAWVHGGVFIGLPPVVVGPPVAYPYPYYYYPPYPYAPGYYPPPPAYYPPPGAPQASTAPQNGDTQMSQANPPPNTPLGSRCSAGVYSCAALPGSHVGTGCSCPGIGAPSYGVVQ